MSTTHAIEFELPNVGAGPDPFVPSETDADALVLLFLRDYHCPKCRAQVDAVVDRYDEFETRNVEVAAVLPEPRDRAVEWAPDGLPYPLLADADAAVGDAFDQPVRFGVLGKLHDFVGRMPAAAVLDPWTGEITYRHEGDSPGDRPSVDELLAAVDAL